MPLELRSLGEVKRIQESPDFTAFHPGYALNLEKFPDVAILMDFVS
jgi:hypothetical protein